MNDFYFSINTASNPLKYLAAKMASNKLQHCWRDNHGHGVAESAGATNLGSKLENLITNKAHNPVRSQQKRVENSKTNNLGVNPSKYYFHGFTPRETENPQHPLLCCSFLMGSNIGKPPTVTV